MARISACTSIKQPRRIAGGQLCIDGGRAVRSYVSTERSVGISVRSDVAAWARRTGQFVHGVVPRWVLVLCLALALSVLAFTTPINHDEDQYIGSAILTGPGQPFVDFLYLQTPLQPWLAAPLIGLVPGHNLTVLRLAGAALALLVIVSGYAAARLAGASDRAARTSMLLMACCHSFLFAAGVVRNDILPAAFATLSTLAALTALRSRSYELKGWLVAGLCLGAAASTKVSYALPCAAMGAFLLLRLRWGHPWAWWALIAYGGGACAGLLPSLIAWVVAPEAFRYGVFDYARAAPFEWYASNGYGWRLTSLSKALDALVVMLLGPILPVLICWLWVVLRGFRERDATVRLLDLLVVAGLIAALLPTPTWKQYFVPLLPPLFIRLATFEPGLPRRARLAIAITVVCGLAPHIVNLARTAALGSPIINTRREAEWIGQTARRLSACGTVATLSVRLVLDSGLPLDPRFANGAFFYRTGDMLHPEQVRSFNAISPATLAQGLDAHPPAAIVTGYENRDHIDRIGLDRGLIAYALSRGYEAQRSPFGKATLFVRRTPQVAIDHQSRAQPTPKSQPARTSLGQCTPR